MSKSCRPSRPSRPSKMLPPPPRLPRNFCWKGRYLVPDLDVEVPFKWVGNNGDIQMIAGTTDSPVHFTNLIFQNRLYTYTYAWPGLQPEFLPPLEKCAPLFKLTLEEVNAFFATASYVGPEILEGRRRCRHKLSRGRRVHHWRVSLVFPGIFPPGAYPRLPIASADIYVRRKDPTKFVKVLHFGLQNLYDPKLDEWIVIDKTSDHPGTVRLPCACIPPSSSSSVGSIPSLQQFLTTKSAITV